MINTIVKVKSSAGLCAVTLPNSDSDGSFRGDISGVVEVRTHSTTKNDSDDNHQEKLCKVSRVSGDIPAAKSDCLEVNSVNLMLCYIAMLMYLY